MTGSMTRSRPRTICIEAPLFAVWSLAVAAALLAGCSGSPSAIDGKGERMAAPAAEKHAVRETWDVYFIQGDRIGYGWTSEQEVADEGRTVLRWEGECQLFVKRFGQPTDFGFRISSLETSDGKVLSLTCETELGLQPALTTGLVEGETLRLQTTTAGKTTTTDLAWPADAGGYFAVEQDLMRRPMQPGEQRTLQAMQPLVNVLAQVELTAGDYEVTESLTGSYELLRIESTLEHPGAKIEQTMWANRAGEVLKTYVPMMQTTSYRTTKEVALKKSDAAFDLGKMSTVKLPKPLENAHRTAKLRYLVELEDGDPASVFVSGPTQQVKSTGPHSAEITVEAIGPDTVLPEGSAARESPPTADDREPNDIVQSKDPRIVAMAKEAAGDEQDPWKTAVALESYVHRHVKEKNYSTAFATASEVAESMSGDCTEHAVLLAALARARGIPARAALGLVYAPSEQGFAYHMWTEVYINGRWIPLDATLGRGGIGAAHLKLADSSLKGATAYSSFLPVAKVIGKLKIEVLEAEGSKQ